MPRCLAPSLLRNTRALRTVKGASPSVGQRDVETLRVVIAAHSDPKVEGDPPTGGHSQRATRGCARYESSPLASSNPAHEVRSKSTQRLPRSAARLWVQLVCEPRWAHMSPTQETPASSSAISAGFRSRVLVSRGTIITTHRRRLALPRLPGCICTYPHVRHPFCGFRQRVEWPYAGDVAMVQNQGCIQ